MTDFRTKLKTMEDWVLKALEHYERQGGANVADIIEYIDWQDHSRYSPEEIGGSLRKLENGRQVKVNGNKWIRV